MTRRATLLRSAIVSLNVGLLIYIRNRSRGGLSVITSVMLGIPKNARCEVLDVQNTMRPFSGLLILRLKMLGAFWCSILRIDLVRPE